MLLSKKAKKIYTKLFRMVSLCAIFILLRPQTRSWKTPRTQPNGRLWVQKYSNPSTRTFAHFSRKSKLQLKTKKVGTVARIIPKRKMLQNHRKGYKTPIKSKIPYPKLRGLRISIWRRGGDSNPRYVSVRTLSKQYNQKIARQGIYNKDIVKKLQNLKTAFQGGYFFIKRIKI